MQLKSIEGALKVNIEDIQSDINELVKGLNSNLFVFLTEYSDSKRELEKTLELDDPALETFNRLMPNFLEQGFTSCNNCH